VSAPSKPLEDVPFGGLPLHDEKIIFEHQYIDLVALEVRWASPLSDIEQSAAVRIRDAIEASVGDLTLPVIERVEQRALTVELGEGQFSQTPVDSGYVLRTQDQNVAVSVLPQSVGIQTSAYTRWSESMRPLIAATLAGVAGALRPGLVSRTGLRYVNRINDDTCTAPKDWASRLSPALVAPYKDWGLQRWVSVARAQIDLALEANHGARLQHGALSPTDYLVDIDVYSQRTQTLDVADMVSSFTRMNRTALAIFQQSVPLEYMRSRQPKGAEQ
jgi:uncharacterized protein (TIGR04255 family)